MNFGKKKKDKQMKTTSIIYAVLIALLFFTLSTIAQNTQLAGNSLTEYPYFEYVKAFNVNADVKVAVDPTLHPYIVDVTADIYIVEAKTVNEWDTDPSLTDITLNGLQTVTFTTSTIQQNTFNVSQPNELSSLTWVSATNDYTGLGHGYDVVIDLNQNGIFDGIDLIDGYSNEAGLYVIHDVTQPGPLNVTTSDTYSVGAIFGIPSNETNEILYYPTNIEVMEPLPLIVMSHGSGHEYTWYDHIALHMASYGYIVMAHENMDIAVGHNHTDAILDLQGEVANGVLYNKIDSSRIIWIGHSHGAINVARSYHKLIVGDYIPTHYTAENIVLISSMLPPGGTTGGGDLPHASNFHMWTASGDDLVSGAAHFDLLQTYQLYERAEGWRMSTTVQGTGHAWFHNGDEQWGPWFTGPCSIEMEGTHTVQKGLFLPLIKHFAEGNIPATDFFYRQYENFHPIGVDITNTCFVVTNECRPNPTDTTVFIIDDYQLEFDENLSSSGSSVSFTVENLTEGRLDDNNNYFTWDASDPFNGATQAHPDDNSRGVVFDWNNTDLYYEWSIISEAQDFSKYAYISLRGAQGTQHPYTLDVLGDLTFSVTLRDAGNVSSSINIGAYGGGLEQPYQRLGGWHNEMERIRISIADFLTNGTGLDLNNIVAVRLNVGPSWGSNKGRTVIDELMLHGCNKNHITGIDCYTAISTKKSELSCYPNPFSNNTTIELNVAENNKGLVHVSVTIINITGEVICNLYSDNVTGNAHHKYFWNGSDMQNHQVASGVYFVKANISGNIINSKLVLIR